MFQIGRICMKIAGRDAGKYCVIIKKEEKNYVLIDGQTRRKKCSTTHLEPTDKKVDISEGATHSDVVKSLDKAGFKVTEKKSTKEKKDKTKRPRKQKVKKVKPVKEKKVEKKPAKDKKPEPVKKD